MLTDDEGYRTGDKHHRFAVPSKGRRKVVAVLTPTAPPRIGGRQRPRVLVFVDHYLPGCKFGGPVRTLANMATRLGPYYEFFVFTADRDFRDAKSYDSVVLDQWIAAEDAMVFYTANRSLGNISMRLHEVNPDLIYLNSFFSRVTMKALFARKFGWFAGIPVLLAPRGEFADGALAIKPWRKKAYIWLANAMGLLRDVTLQASTGFEKIEIERWLKKSLRMAHDAPLVASDLPGSVSQTISERLTRIPKEVGLLRVIFLARISRNKNLDGALRMLREVKGRILFTIAGPIGDETYWRECKALINTMPANVTVNVAGSISHDKVPELLSRHELLLLPTHGENFGHSIIEALTVGCPVLISDRTPWRELERAGVGADLPLEQPERFVAFMQMMMEVDNHGLALWSARAREYGLNRAQSPELLEQNLRIFAEAIQRIRNRPETDILAR